MPWRAGGSPVVIEVSAAGVVDGTTVVIGPPGARPQLREPVGEGCERLPAQAVEHQEHGGAGPGDRRRQPLDRPHAEQRGHDPVTLGPE